MAAIVAAAIGAVSHIERRAPRGRHADCLGWCGRVGNPLYGAVAIEVGALSEAVYLAGKKITGVTGITAIWPEVRIIRFHHGPSVIGTRGVGEGCCLGKVIRMAFSAIGDPREKQVVFSMATDSTTGPSCRRRGMAGTVAVGRTLIQQGRPPGGGGPFKMTVDIGAGAESRISGLRNCRHVAVGSGQRGVVEICCDADPAVPVLGGEAAAPGMAFCA